MKLASELVIDAVIPGERLRTRARAHGSSATPRSAKRGRQKKHIVPPV